MTAQGRREVELNGALLSTCQRMHPSTCTLVHGHLLVRSSRLCWRSSLWSTIPPSLLCLSGVSAMNKVLLLPDSVWVNVFFILFHLTNFVSCLVYIRKLSDRERPLRLRLNAGPNEKVLSFVLKENETGEVNVRADGIWEACLRNVIFSNTSSFLPPYSGMPSLCLSWITSYAFFSVKKKNTSSRSCSGTPRPAPGCRTPWRAPLLADPCPLRGTKCASFGWTVAHQDLTSRGCIQRSRRTWPRTPLE